MDPVSVFLPVPPRRFWQQEPQQAMVVQRLAGPQAGQVAAGSGTSNTRDWWEKGGTKRPEQRMVRVRMLGMG